MKVKYFLAGNLDNVHIIEVLKDMVASFAQASLLELSIAIRKLRVPVKPN